MKKLFLFIALALALVSCDCNTCNETKGGSTVVNVGDELFEIPYMNYNEYMNLKLVMTPLRIIVLDSCEYILMRGEGHKDPVHKGNCRFCQERNKKMMKDAVREVLKEEGIVEPNELDLFR